MANVSFLPLEPLDEIEGPADRGEHPKAQTIDLEETERIEIVLVPLDHGALGHGGIFDGNEMSQGTAGDDHSAHMLGEVAREANELSNELG